MGDRREILTGKIVEDLLVHGVAGLSLRPLAARTGTSARLLVYHYGSKEELVGRVLDEVRKRVQGSFARFRAEAGGQGVLEGFWAWILCPENLACLRLLVEIQSLALHHPETYGRFMERNSSSWLDIIEAGLPESTDRRILATLCAAVIDGLLFEYLCTGDRERTTGALACFSRMLKGRPPAGN